MLNRKAARAALALVVCFQAVAAAVKTERWRERSASDFGKGRCDNLALSMRGRLTLGPNLVRHKGVRSQFVWSLAADASGNLYLGGGSPGVVYRLDKGAGEALDYYRSPDMHVRCLAVDKKGVVYAGACPGAKIYRITPKKEVTVFAALPDKYIWDMKLDAQGRLVVATGLKARVLRIAADGKTEELLDTKENHVLCLALGRKGEIYAGTEPGGLVYMIDRKKTVSVVHDFSEPEIRALALRGASLYVAVAGAGSPIGRPRVMPKTPTAVSRFKTPGSEAAMKGGGGVYEIRLTSLRTEKRVGTGRDPALALALEGADGVLVGVGNRGRLLRMGGTRLDMEILADLPEKQVLAMLSLPGKGVFMGCANPGGLVLAEERFAREGVYTSRAYDTKSVSLWGRISWRAAAGKGGETLLSTRTGNSKEPGPTWSPWSREYAAPDGSQISSPRGRFIQYRARLKTSDPRRSPELDEVSLSFLPMNLPPQIVEIRIGGKPTTPAKRPSPSRFPMSRFGSSRQPSRPSVPDTRGPRSPVMRILWRATDPNGDELVYQALFRAKGDPVWRPIGESGSSTSRTWNTMSAPDGWYELKVVASDSPSNPPGSAMRVERVSNGFVIDNTRPVLKSALVRLNSLGRPTLRGVAVDAASPISGVWVSLAGKRWTPAPASDRVFDSREEAFNAPIPRLRPGAHSILVRIMDSAGNVGAGRVRFRVSARRKRPPAGGAKPPD